MTTQTMQSDMAIQWDTASAELERKSPQAILRWTVEAFGSRLTLGTGLGPSGITLIHMLTQILPNPDIFFLDTGIHFDETYDLLQRVESALGVRIQVLSPTQTVRQQRAIHGPKLWTRDPDLCCYLRKVEPMRLHLANYDAWVTGIRRDQGPSRTNTPIVRYVDTYEVVKIAPLATWTHTMVWSYVEAHDLPHNDLHDEGYASIGCIPCTKPVSAGEPERAGRWAGFSKMECGLHTRQGCVSPHLNA